MLNKAAITEFFLSGGVIYCGNNMDLKSSTMIALEKCGMEIGFDFRTWDISTYNYIFYSVGRQVHMKTSKAMNEVEVDAEEFLSMYEGNDDSWSKDFRMPSFETLYC